MGVGIGTGGGITGSVDLDGGVEVGDCAPNEAFRGEDG